MIIVAIGPTYGVTFFGYMLNGASWGFWPVFYVGAYLVAWLSWTGQPGLLDTSC